MQQNKYNKKRILKRVNQCRLIHEDSNRLIDKESKGTLSEGEILKFKLLIGREPIIKKVLKNVT